MIFDRVNQIYGPLTFTCSKWGIFTRLVLWFHPFFVHETEESVCVYKLVRGDMFVYAAMRKPEQGDRPENS